jgi:hypothetical protein
MGRYVLRYGGPSSAPAQHLDSIRSIPGLQVLDESPKMLLVGGDESSLREKLKHLPGWSIHPEQDYSLPDTREKIT